MEARCWRGGNEINKLYKNEKIGVYLNIKIMLINVNKSCMQSFIEIGQPIKEEMEGKYRYICNGYAPIITVRSSNKSRHATAKISI